MMQNLFGDQSEEEEDVDSEHESNPQPNFASVTPLFFFFPSIYTTIFSSVVAFNLGQELEFFSPLVAFPFDLHALVLESGNLFTPLLLD